MGSTDYKFEGWMGLDKDSADGKMVWQEFEPKKFEENDVDIKITHCGICGSDLHTLRSGWGPTPYPCCVGHEIVGIAVRVGSKVEGGIKVGDRVGVGAQSDSCLGRKGDCEECSSGHENYCPNKFVGTYGDEFFSGDISKGGYALYNRAPSHFVFKIPDGLPSEHAAPMLCAGITTYSPLKSYGAGPGKTVGIIGLGGLGHFGILWAKALGADKIIALSRKKEKRQNALDLGADEYIATDDDKDWKEKYGRSIDIMLSTVSSPKMPIADYLSVLKRDGTLVQVGMPDGGTLPIPVSTLAFGRQRFGGSAIGPPHEIKEMLQFAADKKVEPWIEKISMKNANNAIQGFNDGKPRYRYVLVNEQHL